MPPRRITISPPSSPMPNSYLCGVNAFHKNDFIKALFCFWCAVQETKCIENSIFSEWDNTYDECVCEFKRTLRILKKVKYKEIYNSIFIQTKLQQTMNLPSEKLKLEQFLLDIKSRKKRFWFF